MDDAHENAVSSAVAYPPGPVFVSPFRAGTTSVGAALARLGYRDMSWVPDLFSPEEYRLISAMNEFVQRFPRLRTIPDSTQARLRACVAPLLRDRMAGFDSASDYPMGHEAVHPYLRKLAFPTAKFVFLERERDAYVRSVGRHLCQMADNVYPRLWADPALGEHVAWAQYEGWRDTYTRLRAEFPDDVLLMRVTDGWSELVPFLLQHVDATDAELRAWWSEAAAEAFPWENRSGDVTDDACACADDACACADDACA